MPLNLIIENATSLPDGGPLSYTVSGTRGIDIGRDQYLDWTLPDPNFVISGKHCEVRWRDGGYWLHDVSRNGTFVNQTAQRVQEPYRLRSGDRLYIGHYIVRVHIDGEVSAAPAGPPPVPRRDHRPKDLWSSEDGAAPRMSRDALRPERLNRPVHDDFAHQVIDLPIPQGEVWDGFPPLPPMPGRGPEPAQRELDRPDPHRGGDHAPAAGDPWGPSSLGIGERTWQERTREPASDPRRMAEPVTHTPPTPPAAQRTVEGFVERFAAGAGIPATCLEGRDPGELAEEIGALVRLSVENLKQLLAARAEAKRVARASTQTVIQALDNNPLKFTPTVEDALRILLGRPTSGYLPARRALEEGFRDLKSHQVKVYSAMQHALRLLLQDLDPEAVEASIGDDRGIGALLGSRRARLWDLYTTRWDAMTAPHEDGMVDAFMVYFAECYDRGGKT